LFFFFLHAGPRLCSFLSMATSAQGVDNGAVDVEPALPVNTATANAILYSRDIFLESVVDVPVDTGAQASRNYASSRFPSGLARPSTLPPALGCPFHPGLPSFLPPFLA
jgi:hypothetical protein